LILLVYIDLSLILVSRLYFVHNINHRARTLCKERPRVCWSQSCI